jgi:hypothetical protein
MDLEEVGLSYVEVIYLIQDKLEWRAIVEHGHDKEALCSINADNFLISLMTVTVSVWSCLCVAKHFDFKKSGIGKGMHEFRTGYARKPPRF